MKTWGQLPEWQRARAERLHEICLWLETQTRNGIVPLEAYRQAVARWDKTQLPNGTKPPKILRLSAGKFGAGMRRLYARWAGGERKPTDFVLRYNAAARRVVPNALITEFRKRLTAPGKQYSSAVHRDFNNEWKAGCAVPGLGTWREWWAANHPTEPVPPRPPDFPVALGTLRRYRPHVVTRALAERGIAAAREHIAAISRDSSRLRPCEVYTLDDKEFDLHVYDDLFGSGKIVRPVGYLMMDVGPRYIAGCVVRPGKATAFDVDALIANTLADHGIGNGYATHILFERGTVGCSAAREQFFQANFPGQLFIHRTGMIAGHAHAGAFEDQSTGKPCSKGMIEALMFKLDILLAKFPGQLGNRYQNQPAEAEDRLKQAENLAALEQITGARFDSPILRFSEFNFIIRAAIKQYNHDHDHGCQGFHRVLQMEAQPGVWQDLPSVHTQGDPPNAAVA
jgi:hypothetical protein